VTVDGQTLEVDLVERAGRLFVIRDGTEIPVELAVVRNGAASLLIGRQSVPVVASGPNEDLTLTLGSETWRCSVVDEREAQAAAALGAKGARHSSGVVRAVMPGIVREILVRPGQEVRRGDALLILEAMKMQNEVRAEVPGRVSEIHVLTSVAVAKGDALVTLEPA
jgi:biotin carboxyl carrier protein